ncbi:MAG: AIPR family protein [Trichormus sp. ATA11-4-KO1]|jgi:hypothetical protein|nr:AIPR family protein [Trichormus sp. ATA11-4-KO1]
MNQIIESYLRDFCQEYSLEDLSKNTAFEYFVNYCIISRLHSERFSIEDISIGGGGDNSIDGLAIMVNENLASSTEEIDDLKKALNRLDAKFIFIQTKTSSDFDLGHISKFIHGVRDFFKDQPSRATGQEIKELLELKKHIYSLSLHMEENPVCHMYYVTTGKWLQDGNLLSVINDGIEDLRKTGLFSSGHEGVKFIPVDAEYLQNMYKEIRNKVTREINFERHTILPQIDKVQEAYIGILPCKEYLKLISSTDGTLQKNLFYDNVRDFQGDNTVNSEINDTIKNQKRRDSFVLLNNGATIVAKSINKTGTYFKIKDYQIVNGCQTSHILYKNKDSLDEQIYLPIKLIITADEEITNQIIRATNRQTEVKPEAFWSLQPFNKKLEEFYESFNDDEGRKHRLYYERRSKQYNSSNSIVDNYKVISTATQVKCFLAMFLNEPHSSSCRYYGELLKNNSRRIFVENHSFYPYYLSAYTFYRLEKFIRTNNLNQYYKRFKYQIIMIFRLLALSDLKLDIDLINNKKNEKKFIELQQILRNEEHTLILFQQSITILDKVLENYNSGKSGFTSPPERLKAFTSDLIELTRQHKQSKNLKPFNQPVLKIKT